MKIYSFEKLTAWQESRILVKQVYKRTQKYPHEERFGLISQLRRASVSVSSNIAEGSGRSSAADQRHYYRMAYSSLMEVLNQIILSGDLGFLNEQDRTEVRLQVDKIAKLLSGLVKATR